MPLSNKARKHFFRFGADGLDYFDKLDDVETPLTIFVFRNERLRTPYPFGQDKLREASLFARRDKYLAQAFMSG